MKQSLEELTALVVTNTTELKKHLNLWNSTKYMHDNRYRKGIKVTS